jgi:hypothetical protein
VTLSAQRKGTIWDALKAWAGYGDLTALLSGINNEESPPREYTLHQSYPNPFNPATVIRYELKAAGPVQLFVYDLLGREVAVLVDEIQTPGTKSVVWSAAGQSAGTYFCRLQAAGDHGERFSDVKRMMFLK